MSRALFLRVFGWSVVLALGLTWFYFVHEQLPRFLRAPSSLLLSPISVADGLCYAAGMRGIYGRIAPMFFVNLAFALILGGLVSAGARVVRRRRL